MQGDFTRIETGKTPCEACTECTGCMASEASVKSEPCGGPGRRFDCQGPGGTPLQGRGRASVGDVRPMAGSGRIATGQSVVSEGKQGREPDYNSADCQHSVMHILPGEGGLEGRMRGGCVRRRRPPPGRRHGSRRLPAIDPHHFAQGRRLRRRALKPSPIGRGAKKRDIAGSYTTRL